MNVNDLLSLKDKIILVTGGAGNYGRCIVEGLAEGGATVIIASRNVEAAEKVAANFRRNTLAVDVIQVDQGEHDSIVKLKEQILKTHGRLDVFVNNAVSRPMTGYDSGIEQFAESMRVNATGMFDIVREMADLIVMSGGGSIINIGSMMGMYGPDLSNYDGTVIKNPPPDYFFHNAGLINLTRYLTRILAGKNVRVNSVSPGGLFNNQPDRFVDNYCKKVPLKRMANQDDIKGIMVLLASQAGAYINGENILLDGGLNA